MRAAAGEARRCGLKPARKDRKAKDEARRKSKSEASEKKQLRELAVKEAEAAAKDKERRKQEKIEKEEKRKRDAADVLLQLQEPGYEYFDVSFRQEGSLGLWYRPDGSFPPTLEQKRPGTKLEPGDTLLAVNKVPLPTKEQGGSMEMLVERLSEAMLPRVLHWRRKMRRKRTPRKRKPRRICSRSRARSSL